MVRDSVEMKVKKRRRDVTKKMKVPCNFCELSISSYGCGSESDQQDNEAELQKEVERLRLLIKRMTGKDDDASFTDLQSLQSHLKGVRRIVMEQKRKIKLEEDERLHTQKKEPEDEDDGTSINFLVPRKFSTSSSEERRETQDDGTALLKLKRKFERLNAESLQSKFKRLWLFNERMNGRELEGMTSLDLIALDSQILFALMGLMDQMARPTSEKMARPRKEFACHKKKESFSGLAEQERRYSLDNDKDGHHPDTSLQCRLIFVSKKLRRLQNGFHR